MDFDLLSMKLRVKDFMKNTKPSPWVVSFIQGALAFAYVMGIYFIINWNTDISRGIPYFILLELLYLNFRASAHWYCLKVSREEKTVVSDAFAAFKKRAFKVFVVGLLKDMALFIGFCLCFVGFVFPFYWFRFATYVVNDYEDIGIFGALGKSKQLLKGHAMELFKIDLSNLGWFALGFFTSGLASFCVKPYTTILYAEYYDYLKGQSELFDN